MGNNPKFTVLFEKLRGKTFEIDRDVMSIGRKDENDICLKDGSVSGRHAEIYKSENEDGTVSYILRDNNSSNGTRINSVAIEEQVLKHNDLVMFGSVEVLFDSNDGSAADSNATSINRLTHTIDLSSMNGSLSTTPALTSLNPLAVAEEKKRKMIHSAIIAIIAVIALGALGALVYCAINIFSK
ncbi:MAG: FHA domain-containing protein [Lentisphaeria bacterium]|nr:FHA domain-containing protein [Lentisphaeria bacterium]